MTSTLDTEPVASLIAELYERAAAVPRPGPTAASGPSNPPLTAAEQAKAAEDRYMPISPDSGRLMYSLIRAARPHTLVEFGMSYGISTLHLAAAVRDNGVGHLYTTELSEKKIAAAQHTFAEAGLADVVTILDGDALETLRTVDGEIGFVLFDGWKDLYLPVLELLEPRLSTGCLLIADNTESPGAAPYLERVRHPANGYTSVNFPGKEADTMELSCRV
ncbi:class I SAM-dependent methyltransferase [Gordonia sp. PKS22-38]|uniref:Class I SAM-dependent methyltransferase n=1 Tax=Gordonia prachuapensis TaxID=3115651 RepID=A0ABU7MTP6_9ACTN|nr:class I SAM-dependent methyltransferase [Gordonia sp. PKS22-38]